MIKQSSYHRKWMDGERQSTNWGMELCVNHHRARQMFGAGSHSRSYMQPVTFNQTSLLDDFQIQPDLVTVVPGAAHPQLRMNFNQCEFSFSFSFNQC